MDLRDPCRRKKKVFLTIGQKTQILQEFESGCAINELCKKYNIHQSVIYKWKRKQGILQMNVQKYADSRILRVSRNRLINDAVFAWFREIKKSGILPSGPAIKTKALEFYEQIGGNTEFLASTGWLDWWKKTYNINHLRINSEIAVQRTSTIVNLVKEKGLSLKQIFSAYEFALYSKALPINPQNNAIKEESHENLDDRLTVMPCCNADGSLKLPLLTLGKTTLNNVNSTTIYVNEKHAWLNRRIFQDWFENVFVPRVKAFLLEQTLPLKAVLIVDQACPYNINQQFIADDINVILLPPVMPVSNPLNQGIVNNLKYRYRIQLVLRIVEILKNNVDFWYFLNRITMEDILSWLSLAWMDVDSKIIANCWQPLLSLNFEMRSEIDKSQVVEFELEEQLVQLIAKIGLVLSRDCIEKWVNGDQIHFANTELDRVIVATALQDNIKHEQDSVVDNHIFIKTEVTDDEPTSQSFEGDPLELEREHAESEEIVEAFDKVIAYCKQKQIANADEIATLVHLRRQV